MEFLPGQIRRKNVLGSPEWMGFLTVGKQNMALVRQSDILNSKSATRAGNCIRSFPRKSLEKTTSNECSSCDVGKNSTKVVNCPLECKDLTSSQTETPDKSWEWEQGVVARNDGETRFRGPEWSNEKLRRTVPSTKTGMRRQAEQCALG
jgi:hypothetical protein